MRTESIGDIVEENITIRIIDLRSHKRRSIHAV